MHDQLSDQLPALRRYARMLTGDAWAADDLIQDTLERACRKWSLWTAGSNLRAWLFTLMHHQHVSQVRSRAHHPPPGALVDVADAESELVAPSPHTDEQLDLQRCLLRLPPDQRQVLLLVTVEDLGYQATADLLGVPVGTVMSRLHRARSRLRELMEGEHAAASAPQTAPPLKRLK